MSNKVIEASYPINFRHEDAALLGDHLRHRHAVAIIGMKRVGISNFLRFFLHHKDIVPTYISKTEKHLFIPVDLNDLVEREIFPFWTLTLKRIVDVASTAAIKEKDKAAIEALFLKAIQTQDHFLAVDSVRHALTILIENNTLPTLFFIRFDRIKDALTPTFLDNLYGLLEATTHKVSFVFTTYRSLSDLAPAVFPRATLSTFAQPMYIKRANDADMESIYNTYEQTYELRLSPEVKTALLSAVNGYIQYLQLSLIILHEHKAALPKDPKELLSLLSEDERIHLQSEELWESLTSKEKSVLEKVSKGEEITSEERQQAAYVWDTGFIVENEGTTFVFSPLFARYMHELQGRNLSDVDVSHHFSRKEHELFSLLEKHKNEICEREEIIEAVWSESKDFGISDWAIDRLVARVRSKLKRQDSPYEIKTIRTRGYQLTTKA